MARDRRVSTRIKIAKAVVAFQAAPQSVASLRESLGLSRCGAEAMFRDFRDARLIEFTGFGERHPNGGKLPSMYGWKG